MNRINAIKIAYQKKDKEALQNYLVPTLAESILKEFLFDKVELSFSPRTVRIKASTVMVNINWHGTWVMKGKSIKNRGIAVFVLDGDPIKLSRVEGDNPFHIPLVKE